MGYCSSVADEQEGCFPQSPPQLGIPRRRYQMRWLPPKNLASQTAVGSLYPDMCMNLLHSVLMQTCPRTKRKENAFM